jgi:hypothetical protein
MASAFLTLPLVYLSVTLEGRIDATAVAVQTVIQACGTVLFIAIVLYLKRLLNTLCDFHSTDRNLGLLIVVNMVTGGLSIASLYFPAWKEALETAALALLIVQGGIQVQFGYRLLKLPDSLGGMLRPFCYANMATGILLASVVLIPLAILVSAVSDLMLGTIFFNMARTAREEDLTDDD